MKISHPLLGVSLALGFVLYVFAFLSTSAGPLLAAGSVAPPSFCGELQRASQHLADIPDAKYDNGTAQAVHPALRFHGHSFTCSPPSAVLADGCYPSGSFCNQDRQCCSRVCNKDGGAWGHCL